MLRACLPACSKGEWSEVEIPLTRFLLTWRGKVVEEKVELNAKRVTTLGISLAGRDQLQPEVREAGTSCPEVCVLGG